MTSWPPSRISASTRCSTSDVAGAVDQDERGHCRPLLDRFYRDRIAGALRTPASDGH
jgi:hypothetical protein